MNNSSIKDEIMEILNLRISQIIKESDNLLELETNEYDSDLPKTLDTIKMELSSIRNQIENLFLKKE